MTPFWFGIVALCTLAAIINFALAAGRLHQPLAAGTRAVAGLLSLGLAIGIPVGKAFAIPHVYLTQETVLIAVGIFIAVVFMIPSYVDKGQQVTQKPTIQERAARPVKATIRLRDAGSDEWVN